MIPKIFHQVWINSKEPSLPAEYAGYRDKWLALHPDWQYRLWNLDNLDFALRRPELLVRCGSYSQMSDVLRFEVLHRYGGVYIDTDFECRRSIEPLLDNVDTFFCSEDGATISAGIAGSMPASPVFLRLLMGLPDTLGRLAPNIESGPVHVTRVLLNEGFAGGVTLFPRRFFYPYNWTELDRAGEPFPDAYAIHRYAHSWKQPLTLGQRLLRRFRRAGARPGG